MTNTYHLIALVIILLFTTQMWLGAPEIRDSNGISKLPLIQLILPYKISCIKGSSAIPLLSLVIIIFCVIQLQSLAQYSPRVLIDSDWCCMQGHHLCRSLTRSPVCRPGQGGSGPGPGCQTSKEPPRRSKGPLRLRECIIRRWLHCRPGLS